MTIRLILLVCCWK